MEYRNIGKAGVKISVLSFGSWMTFSKQLDVEKAKNCISAAYDYGVNFFDNAEVYANGKSEEIMGQVFKKLDIPRLKYLVSTKFFWGISEGPNESNTLNRKYLLNGITNSLKRLQMEYVDIVYCHRADPKTPIEETVWAMHNIIERGYALYWGTSEWNAEQISEAYEIAEKHHLHKPIVEQPQYNLFARDKVEKEFMPLYKKYGMGLTTWSPLASGILTGKYLNGNIPAGSRLAMESLSWLKDEALNQDKQKKIQKFVTLSKELGVTPATLGIAWCAKNPNVSSVITGASSVEQVKENMKAMEVIAKLDSSAMKAIEAIFV